MPREITMGAQEKLGSLEYQKFTEWYKSYYNKEAPPNGIALVNDPVYRHWANYIRPATWSPQMETEATQKGFEIIPEEQKAFTDWYKGVYNKTPTEKAMQPGSIWHQAFREQFTPPPTTTPTGVTDGGAKQEVITEGGRDFLVTYDETGKIILREHLGITPEARDEGITPFQQAQINRWGEQDTQQLRLAQAEREQSIANWNQARTIGHLQGDSSVGLAFERDRIKEQLASQWDKQMTNINAVLEAATEATGKDWIKDYQARRQMKIDLASMSNPFTVRPDTTADELSRMKEELKSLNQSTKTIEERNRDPFKSVTEDEQIVLDARNRLEETIHSKEARYYSSPEGQAAIGRPTPYGWEVGGGDPEGIATRKKQQELQMLKSQPATPLATMSLAGLVPGLTAGQPITKQAIETPSQQTWAKTPLSEREKWAGYSDWAGGTPYRDVLQQMGTMSSQAPSLGRRWQPARQA